MMVHYCVANMPGAVLLHFYDCTHQCNTAMPFNLQKVGKKHAEKRRIKLGLNIVHGKIVYKGVADAFNLLYQDVSTIL